MYYVSIYLLPPYSMNDVFQFENKLGVRLTPFFRAYLLYVSRETYYSGYRTCVHLNCEGTHRDDIREMTESERREYWNERKNESMKFPSVFDGTIEVGDDGCEYSHDLVVRGDSIGLVMCVNSSNDYGYDDIGHIDQLLRLLPRGI